jgi:hypothetical protein
LNSHLKLICINLNFPGMEVVYWAADPNVHIFQPVLHRDEQSPDYFSYINTRCHPPPSVSYK